MYRKLGIFLLVWCLSAVGWSCQVPVFRYALERWTTESYRVIVMHREPLSPQLSSKLTEVNQSLSGEAPAANLVLEVVDLSKTSEQALWSLPDADAMESDPWMVLVGPLGDKPVLSEPCTEASISNVLDSPARQEWVKMITKGVSVVWVVIPGNDDVAKAKETLEAALVDAEKNIQLPEGVLKPEEVASATGEIDLEDVLRSPIPLKIDFETLTVDRNDPKEAAFIAMLTQGVPDSAREETLIVPLFGRGRALQALPASRLNAELVMAGCNYLCGACSCQVKDQNPGLDIVVSENWDKHLQDGLVVVERELPPLEGVGDLEQKNAEPEISKQLVTEDEAKNESGEGMLPIAVVVPVSICVILVIGASFLLVKGKKS